MILLNSDTACQLAYDHHWHLVKAEDSLFKARHTSESAWRAWQSTAAALDRSRNELRAVQLASSKSNMSLCNDPVLPQS